PRGGSGGTRDGARGSPPDARAEQAAADQGELKRRTRMPVYKWQGVSPKGAKLSGEMDAPSREAVIIRLRGQRIQPDVTKVREKGKGLDYEIKLPTFGAPVSGAEIVGFTRQFRT